MYPCLARSLSAVKVYKKPNHPQKTFTFCLLTGTTHVHWASCRICLQCGRPKFDPWVRKIPWRRKWQPVPVFLPGESHGRRSLVGYSPRGPKESDMTEPPHFTSLHPAIGYDLSRHACILLILPVICCASCI